MTLKPIRRVIFERSEPRNKDCALVALAAVSRTSLAHLYEIVNEIITELEIEGLESWRDVVDTAASDSSTYRYLLSEIVDYLGIDVAVAQMLGGPERDIEYECLTDHRSIPLPPTGRGIIGIAKGQSEVGRDILSGGFNPAGHVLIFDEGLVQDTTGSEWRTLANLMSERYPGYGVRSVATIETNGKAKFLTADDLVEIDSFVDSVGYMNRLTRFDVNSEHTPSEILWNELSENATEGEQRFLWYEHIAMCSYPVLFKRDINRICEALPEGDILSVGCGSGYIEWCFEKYGNRRVIATDPRIDDRFGWLADWTEIIKVDAVDAMMRYQNADILMVSWAYPEDGNWDFEALARFQGDWLIYLGEPAGGYTSTEMFFEELDYGWELQLLLPTARVPFLRDTAQVFRRKPNSPRALP